MTSELLSFADFGLSDVLLKALAEMNFTTPSPVQAQAIPFLLEGHDIIAQAQTGTGKTAAFALPILQKLTLNSNATQALIIAPTRELAIQVASQFEILGSGQKNTRISVLCGGQNYVDQLKKLREGAQIVVGTPGRIIDHIERGTLKLENLKTFVLDEADEMLRMGFIEDVELILSKLPKVKQIALFSATMPSRIRQIANNYLTNPMSVEIRSETATVKSIEQRFVMVSPMQKPDVLLRVLAVEEYQGVIVFVRTKSSTEDVAESLQQQGYRAMAIHGDIAQTLRERIVAQFRQGAIDILVATDVAARGLDVERVTHVINYDPPHDHETYVHRIGRTGRAGRSGITILFISPRETRNLNALERHTRQRIDKVNIPDNFAIQNARQQRLMNNITTRLEHDHLPAYQKIIEEFLEKNPEVSASTVAATIALLLNKDKAWRCDLPTIKPTVIREQRTNHTDYKERSYKNDRKPSTYRDSAEKNSPDDGQQALFRIDVGRIHGVKPGNIVGAIANEAGLQSRFITGVKIHEDHSTVKLPKSISKEVFRDLNKAWVCGRQLKLTLMAN